MLYTLNMQIQYMYLFLLGLGEGVTDIREYSFYWLIINNLDSIISPRTLKHEF